VVRVSFSDMASALARGDLDAYVGAEPAPGISLANGTGRVLEYPYSTPTGSLNMVLTSREAHDGNRGRCLICASGSTVGPCCRTMNCGAAPQFSPR